MTWNAWKQKDSEFKGWTVPSLALARYWHFLANELVNKIAPCNLLLDVGCGTGSLLTLVGESRKCVTAIGIDPNLPHLKLIQDKSVHKIRAVGENLPLKDCRIDAIVVKATLDHARHAEEVLREIYRVGTSRSRIYILQGIVENSKLETSHTHVRDFTMAQLQHLLRITKLRILTEKTFFSMRLQRILMLIPIVYDFLSRFLGKPSVQIIVAIKRSNMNKTLDIGRGHVHSAPSSNDR